ncbi:hypothetical protein [Micromonospora sagamiensis]|uniref:hypothetical protein n=1 Tax=Micromonospora sagamiensis TaxID=47875 RepID=UPI0011A509A1|nr:hypothetical protein [Micromonospora sagamiensis]BCL13298.1 hypothetical protein GCM10017556_10370 [Micromonospora sagamiensis]
MDVHLWVPAGLLGLALVNVPLSRGPPLLAVLCGLGALVGHRPIRARLVGESGYDYPLVTKFVTTEQLHDEFLRIYGQQLPVLVESEHLPMILEMT